MKTKGISNVEDSNTYLPFFVPPPPLNLESLPLPFPLNKILNNCKSPILRGRVHYGSVYS